MSSEKSPTNEERWRKLLTEGHHRLRFLHLVFRHMPSPPRCKVCHNPFGGFGGKFAAALGFRASRKNPNLCTRCCDGLPPGGAEVDVSVLFADVRGARSCPCGESYGRVCGLSYFPQFIPGLPAICRGAASKFIV